MSESDNSQSQSVDGVVGGGEEIGRDDDGSARSDDSSKKTKKKAHGSGGNFRKALFRFGKKEGKIRRRKSRAADSSSAGTSGKKIGGGFGVYCCFKQTPTLDSPVGSQICDPNSPEFTHDMLRALIEKNDFYSKECNPHLEIDNTHED